MSKESPLGEESQEHINDGAEAEDHNSQGQIETERMLDDDRQQNDQVSANNGGEEKNDSLSDYEVRRVTNGTRSLHAASRRQDDFASSNIKDGGQIDFVNESGDDNIPNSFTPCYQSRRGLSEMPWNRYDEGQNTGVPDNEDTAEINTVVTLDNDTETEERRQVCAPNFTNPNLEQITVMSRSFDGNVPDVVMPLNDEDELNAARPLDNYDFRRISQEISSRALRGQIGADRPGPVVHIRSLAYGDLRLSETLEIWTWPFPDDG